MFEERDKKKCSDDLRTVSQLRPGESVFPLPLNLCFFVFLHTAEIFAAKKIGWANEREERGQTEKRSRSLSLSSQQREALTQTLVLILYSPMCRRHYIVAFLVET